MMTKTTNEHPAGRRRALTTGLAAAAVLLAACAMQPAAAAVSYFAIQTRQAQGGFEVVGNLVLQADGRGEISISATGPEADRLRRSWSEVSARPVLETKQRNAEGMIVGRKVGRGSPEYGDALADVMSREFGYFLVGTGAPK